MGMTLAPVMEKPVELPVGYARPVAPKPHLKDGADKATNIMRRVVEGLMAHRTWQVTEVAEHIERGRRMLDRGELSIEGANWMIRHLRAMNECRGPSPMRYPRPAAVAARVPDGYYMVNGRRFHVTRETSGRRIGQLKLRELLGKGRSRVIAEPWRGQIIAWIAAGPIEAAIEYGRETTRCNKCNRKMWDPESVKYGRGPDCRDKYGLA